MERRGGIAIPKQLRLATTCNLSEQKRTEMTLSFPEIATERFLLRKIVSTDKDVVFEGLSHPEVIRYYGVSYHSFDAVQEQMDWYEDLLITQTGIWWAVCRKDDPRMIGACGFNEIQSEHRRTEIGFWLLPQFFGQGIMAEVVPAIIEYAFSHLHIHRIQAIVESENAASKKLLAKLGFAFEGTHRECEFKNGRFIDLDYFALLNKV